MAATTFATTSIKSTKVLSSPYNSVSTLHLDTTSRHDMMDKQGVGMAGYVPVNASKDGVKEGMHTPQQVIAFGGIRQEDVCEVRSSRRLSAQPNSDATQMEKAMKIAKHRAELPVLGKSPLKPSSITSFTDDHIVEHALSLGVSLGNSHSDCVATARFIKDVELQRTLTLLKNQIVW
jgi:hypothetical protein